MSALRILFILCGFLGLALPGAVLAKDRSLIRNHDSSVSVRLTLPIGGGEGISKPVANVFVETQLSHGSYSRGLTYRGGSQGPLDSRAGDVCPEGRDDSWNLEKLPMIKMQAGVIGAIGDAMQVLPPPQSLHANEKRWYAHLKKHIDWNRGCSNFIDSQGNFGPWGQHVQDALGSESPYLSPLLETGAGDLAQACPRFPKMSLEERKAFWVWFFAAMAQHESGCDPRQVGDGPNGPIAGLCQLHQGAEASYMTEWQKKVGAGPTPGCRARMNSLDPLQNLSCCMLLVSRDLDLGGKVFHRNTYFQVTRPGRGSENLRTKLSALEMCHKELRLPGAFVPRAPAQKPGKRK